MNPILKIIIFLVTLWFSYLESIYRFFVPASKKSVKNKIVLVTGAGRNIGKEIALGFARQGARLAICDVDAANNRATCEEIRSLGGEAYPYRCDVTDIDSVKKMAEGIRQDMGEVDILINNAGIMNVKEIMDLSETDIRRTMEINTMSHFWTVREFLPSMLDRNEGHIVTIASIAGKFPAAMLTDYCASKYGAVGLAEALREEMHRNKKNVQISVVCPFFVMTNLITDHGDRIKLVPGTAPVMNAKQVGETVVDGVLRNYQTIYVPPHIGLLKIFDAIFPLRAVNLLRKLDPVGFFPGQRDTTQ